MDNLEEAKLHAFDHACDILADHRADETLCESLSMLVTDETGRRVYHLSISASPVPA